MTVLCLRLSGMTWPDSCAQTSSDQEQISYLSFLNVSRHQSPFDSDSLLLLPLPSIKQAQLSCLGRWSFETSLPSPWFAAFQNKSLSYPNFLPLHLLERAEQTWTRLPYLWNVTQWSHCLKTLLRDHIIYTLVAIWAKFRRWKMTKVKASILGLIK